jgi:hypothetical protein
MGGTVTRHLWRVLCTTLFPLDLEEEAPVLLIVHRSTRPGAQHVSPLTDGVLHCTQTVSRFVMTLSVLSDLLLRSHTFPSFPFARSTGFFSSFHLENMMGLLEIKQNLGFFRNWAPCSVNSGFHHTEPLEFCQFQLKCSSLNCSCHGLPLLVRSGWFSVLLILSGSLSCGLTFLMILRVVDSQFVRFLLLRRQKGSGLAEGNIEREKR